MKTLPKTPSKFISMALKDLRKIEKDERYIVDMGNWHYTRNSRGPCYVCLAGAVMARELGSDPGEWRVPGNFPRVTTKLWALDYLRRGDPQPLLKAYGQDPGAIRPRRVPEYRMDRKGWFEAMEALMEEFRGIGL